MAYLDKGVKYRRWVEPFLGGGSVALEAMRRGLAQEYMLGDSLRPIVDTWQQLQRDPEWLITELHQFAALPFEQQRGILQACNYNGMWRESKKSGYNVGFSLETKSGKRSAPHLNFEAIAEAVKLLSANQVRVLCSDFAETIVQAGEGDLVYADPPYLGTHSAYSAAGFNLTEHDKLARLLVDAKKRGAVCWVSGSDSEDTQTNYCEVWGGVAYELNARRSIGCKVASRGVKTELLIRM